MTESRPTLRGVEGGLVEVVGGLRRFVANEASATPAVSAPVPDTVVTPLPSKDAGADGEVDKSPKATQSKKTGEE